MKRERNLGSYDACVLQLTVVVIDTTLNYSDACEEVMRKYTGLDNQSYVPQLESSH